MKYTISITTQTTIRIVCLVAAVLVAGSTSFAQNTYVFANDFYAGTLRVSSVDPSSGALTLVPGIAGSIDTYTLWVQPDSRCQRVYANEGNASAIAGFNIDWQAGALNPVPGSPVSVPFQPTYSAIDATGRFYYVPTQTSNVFLGFSIDQNSGALTPVPGSPFTAGTYPTAAFIDLSNRFLYVSNDASGDISGFIIDQTTGGLTPISGSPWPSGQKPRFMTSDRTGKFLFVSNTDSGNVSIFNVDQSTGALTQTVPAAPVAWNNYWIAVDAGNKYAYVGLNGGPTFGFSINNATGALTPLPGFPMYGSIFDRAGILADPTSEFLYTSNRDDTTGVWSIDPATGALTQVSGSPFPVGAALAVCKREAYAAQIQPPIDADGTSVFNAKKGVVPVKFTLTVDGTPTCNLPPATISVARTSGGTVGPIDEIVYQMSADSGSNFRIDSTACQYIYNLASKSLGVGTYLLKININNSAVGNATFGLQ